MINTILAFEQVDLLFNITKTYIKFYWVIQSLNPSPNSPKILSDAKLLLENKRHFLNVLLFETMFIFQKNNKNTRTITIS